MDPERASGGSLRYREGLRLSCPGAGERVLGKAKSLDAEIDGGPLRDMSETMGLSIDRISTDIEFTALKEEWNSLLTESGSNEISLTWEWLYTWWKVFRDDSRRLLILAVRD